MKRHAMRVDDAEDQLYRSMALAERRRQRREAIQDIAGAVAAAIAAVALIWWLFDAWGWL